jgi:hypothetical protein
MLQAVTPALRNPGWNICPPGAWFNPALESDRLRLARFAATESVKLTEG